jgi:hypothetical protein
MQFTMTKEEALKIQADHVAWYNRDGSRPWLAAKVASLTQADKLEAGKQYPVAEINKYIPRGGSIENLCGVDFGGN